MTVKEIYAFLDKIAPFDGARGTDNCGLLVGDPDAAVEKAAVVLDVTPEILDEASRKGVTLIISHHPIIYTPLRALSAGTPAFGAARSGINVICAHTNLDVAPGGVNDCFIGALGFDKLGSVEGTDGCAALCRCPESFSEPGALARHVRDVTGAGYVRLLDGGRPVKTLAVCCGGGASFFEAVLSSGADGFVTGDLKYPQAVEAKRYGFTLVDVGHYETEILFADPLIKRLSAEFPEVEFIRARSDRPFFAYV